MKNSTDYCLILLLYRALKREFDLDDEFLADLKTEIIEAKRLAIDENSTVLVWKDSPASSVQKEAEEYFQKAIEVARQQQVKSLELWAAMSLSRLWQQQGKKEATRTMLAEIYDWFTEGFDTKDLQEAKALLAELS